ncbi:uncharacterized protein LOC130622227 [Hydractinia symbiolongicarpus]|uniref:uncharacterized protein LOC130622227 n=1 Tax=Hydractinia symbiolongicarpus TaxID=13093 RepID=UPI00255082D3|nr:uncharacterized protein LOC130622227 [Hydractinia symbiolongicarpus]
MSKNSETNQVFVGSTPEAQAAEESNEETTFETISSACHDIRQQSLNAIMKWSQTFGDSEKFDNFYHTRIDELIKEASQLEQTLIRQKQMLKERLKNLTKTLALVSENES